MCANSQHAHRAGGTSRGLVGKKCCAGALFWEWGKDGVWGLQSSMPVTGVGGRLMKMMLMAQAPCFGGEFNAGHSAQYKCWENTDWVSMVSGTAASLPWRKCDCTCTNPCVPQTIREKRWNHTHSYRWVLATCWSLPVGLHAGDFQTLCNRVL